MKKPSVVVDTNLFISALIVPKSKPSKLIKYWNKGAFTLVTSVPLLKELEEVVGRSKYTSKYAISLQAKERLFIRLRRKAKRILSLKKPAIEIRDIKDLVILATALDSQADYLVIGDKDLLTLNSNPTIKPLKIITVDEFLKHLK